MERVTGRIEFMGPALSALVYGGGTRGNAQVLQTEAIVDPETGERHDVPYVSGAELKHIWLRDPGVRYALDVMGVPDGGLPAAVVHLLFSGGALSSTGKGVSIGAARRLAELFPIISVCGFSAGNTMSGSQVTLRDLMLVCAENRWRAPDWAREHPAWVTSCIEATTRYQRTRHDPTRDRRVAGLLAAGDRAAEEERRAANLAVREGGGNAAELTRDASAGQMIFTYQAVKPGATWVGELYYHDLAPLEAAALQGALSYACLGTHGGGVVLQAGGKRRLGHGLVAMRVTAQERLRPAAPTERESSRLLPVPRLLGDEAGGSELAEAYAAHLRANRDAILEALAEVAR